MINGNSAPASALESGAGCGDPTGIRMSAVDRLYDWLAEGPTPDCDRTLAAGLTHAEPAYRERIVRLLLKRGHPASRSGLIENYEHLSAEARGELRTDRARFQSGIVEAFKARSPEARRNAMLALEDDLDVRLAYLLPEALRDNASEVRGAAGRVLRKTTEAFLERSAPATNAEQAELDEYASAEEHLARALGEALRTFELHNRLETLEPCLWFARKLNDSLWDAIGATSSVIGNVVSEHLDTWNDPRLAGFLLQALARPAWRRQARALLEKWHSLDKLKALLGESRLLENTEIRRYLRTVKRPRWIDAAGRGLRLLPPDLRVLVPGWLCCLGFKAPEKMSYLRRWLDSPYPELQRAAAHALSTLNTPEAAELLEKLAVANSPLTPFARWQVAGREAGLTAAPKDAPANDEEASAGPTYFPGDAPPDAEFEKIWALCRQTSPRENHQMVEFMREHVDLWRGLLATKVRSPDPRDRLLMLQIVGTPALVGEFQRELKTLSGDSVAGIRQLAASLEAPLPEETSPDDAHADEPITPIDAEPETDPESPPQAEADQPALNVADLAESRRKLNAMLAEIAAENVPATELATLIHRVRPLLREIMGRDQVAAGVGGP